MKRFLTSVPWRDILKCYLQNRHLVLKLQIAGNIWYIELLLYQIGNKKIQIKAEEKKEMFLQAAVYN